MALKIKCSHCGNDTSFYQDNSVETELSFYADTDKLQVIDIICPDCDTTGVLYVKVVDIEMNEEDDEEDDEEESGEEEF